MSKYASRTKTYASSALNDTDGVKPAFATTTTVQTFTTGVMTGAAISSGVLDLPRSLTVTLSNTTGAFTTDPIVVTGVRGGTAVTASFTPADANGNATLANAQPFDRVSTITVPAQVLTTATIEVGVRDVCAPVGSKFCGVEVAAAGTLHMQYGDGGATDAIAIPAALVGYRKEIAPTRVLTSGSQTTVGITVYVE